MFDKSECPQCAIYREWLAQVSEEKKFFVAKSFHDDSIVYSDNPMVGSDFPVIQKSSTLSGLRSRLELELRNKHSRPDSRLDTAIAQRADLSEAENTFLKELDNGRKVV